MAVHFADRPEHKCRVCGQPFSAQHVVPHGRSQVLVGPEYTNDAGFWNAAPVRCAPRFQITTIDNLLAVVPVASALSSRTNELPRTI